MSFLLYDFPYQHVHLRARSSVIPIFLSVVLFSSAEPRTSSGAAAGQRGSELPLTHRDALCGPTACRRPRARPACPHTACQPAGRADDVPADVVDTDIASCPRRNRRHNSVAVSGSLGLARLTDCQKRHARWARSAPRSGLWAPDKQTECMSRIRVSLTLFSETSRVLHWTPSCPRSLADIIVNDRTSSAVLSLRKTW